MNSIRFTPKRLVVESVRDNLRRTQASLAVKQCERASCIASWTKHEALANEGDVSGLTFNETDARHRDQALSGYNRDIAEMEKELKLWEDALSHALDSLEA
jgi:hypothetical protein